MSNQNPYAFINNEQIAILKKKHILADNGETIISCTSGMSEGVSVIALQIGMSKDDSVFTYLSVSCAIQFAKHLLDSLLKSTTGESYAPIQLGTLYLKKEIVSIMGRDLASSGSSAYDGITVSIRKASFPVGDYRIIWCKLSHKGIIELIGMIQQSIEDVETGYTSKYCALIQSK